MPLITKRKREEEGGGGGRRRRAGGSRSRFYIWKWFFCRDGSSHRQATVIGWS
jgi:hypothetical protein